MAAFLLPLGETRVREQAAEIPFFRSLLVFATFLPGLDKRPEASAAGLPKWHQNCFCALVQPGGSKR